MLVAQQVLLAPLELMSYVGEAVGGGRSSHW